MLQYFVILINQQIFYKKSIITLFLIYSAIIVTTFYCKYIINNKIACALHIHITITVKFIKQTILYKFYFFYLNILFQFPFFSYFSYFTNLTILFLKFLFDKKIILGWPFHWLVESFAQSLRYLFTPVSIFSLTEGLSLLSFGL